MEIKSKERSEIEEKYKWDLSIMYSSDEKWDEDFQGLSEDVKLFASFANTLGESAKHLLDVMHKRDEMIKIYEKLAGYAMRKSDEDTRNDEGTKLKNKVIMLGSAFSEADAFFEPELLSIGSNKIASFMDEDKDLKLYAQYFDNVFRFKDHTLSPTEEKILATASEVLASPNKTYTMLHNADLKFGSINDEEGNNVELTKGNYARYVSSQDRDVRKEAFHTLYKSYASLKNTFAEILIGDVKANYFISKNRKYNNPLEAALYNNNIDVKVYDNVIDIVNSNLDKMHHYVALRKEVLELNDLYMYDLYVDLIKEYDIEYSYEEAVELIFEALKPLGDEYIKNARRAFDERWIDVYENNGKVTGAYSSQGYDTPPYILLNYDGKYKSVSTVIHELGHSMHTYYSANKQPYIYHDYVIFVAEVASNVNEMLLNMYMIEHAENKEEKLSLINDFLESVKGSIYRQTMFAEFEKTIYEKEGNNEVLTEEELSNIYYDLNKKYYGDDVTYDDEIRYEWMRIPHFYYNFYVYQYATGLTAAFFIAKDLFNNVEGAREKYIDFLSSGSSDYPLELLNRVGIDMTSAEPMQKILDYFNEQINEFEKLIKEK